MPGGGKARYMPNGSKILRTIPHAAQVSRLRRTCAGRTRVGAWPPKMMLPPVNPCLRGQSPARADQLVLQVLLKKSMVSRGFFSGPIPLGGRTPSRDLSGTTEAAVPLN